MSADEFYVNTLGKVRPKSSPEIVAEETASRLVFVTGFVPGLSAMFGDRGVPDVVIQITGSLAAQEADVGSDIDLLITRGCLATQSDALELGHAACAIKNELDCSGQLPYKIDLHFPIEVCDLLGHYFSAIC
jgi:hypothetical protein